MWDDVVHVVMGNRWGKSSDYEVEYAVYVHVYEIGPKGMAVSMLKTVSGMGVCHTGTEIRPVRVGDAKIKRVPEYGENDGIEYAFGGADRPGTGVWVQDPKCLPQGFAQDTGRFKQSVDMGKFQMTTKQLREEIKQLKQEWPAVCYPDTIVGE